MQFTRFSNFTKLIVMKSLSRKWFHCFGVLFMSVIVTGSTYKDVIVIDHFKTGGLNYVISGEKAIINGNHVHLTGVQARLKQSNGEIYLFTPICDFDQAKKVSYSDRPVHIRNESMTIDGTGFDLDINRSHVTVRKDVKVRIYNYRDDLLGK